MIALGKNFITPAVSELLTVMLHRKNNASPHEHLSERELQVFLQLAKGHNVTEVARLLSLSIKTAGTYRTRLLEKMSFASNSDLTYYALKKRLID